MNIKYPKKSLGQNFLNDKNIIDIIVSSGDIKKNDTILEVGPGTGNLTEKILSKKPKKIFAIEKDEFLATPIQSNLFLTTLNFTLGKSFTLPCLKRTIEC